MTWELTFESEICYLAQLKLKHIVIPYDLLIQTKKNTHKSPYQQRFYISINGCEPWQAGTVALGDDSAYITVKSALLKQMALQVGDFVQVQLKSDDSEYGMPVSEELLELLRQDPEAEARFLDLSMAMKRYIIYYVNQVKSSTKKIERGVLLLSNLKRAPQGKETFRQLLGKE